MTQRPVIRLSTETVIAIHSELIDKIGGGHGIRDKKLLDMAINSIYQTFDNNDLYPTIIDKATHLVYSLIKNHPFLDGNKRIAVTAMIIFLKSNDVNFKCTNDELAAFGLGLADGSLDEKYAHDWINSHIII